MPALSSIIAYRPGKRAKAAIKAPFSLLRGDSSIASSSTSQQPFTPLEPPDVIEQTDVIDINHYSLDSDRAVPKPSFEQDVLDDPRSYQFNLSTSPQVELDIDLSSNGLSDWLEDFNSGDAKKEAKTRRRMTRLNHLASLNGKLEELKEGQGEADGGASLSEDMVASLQAMVAEHDDISQLDQESSSIKHPYAISIPDSTSTNRQASRPPDLFIGTRSIRPLSSQSDIASSAISGTTIARALMSNSFILSSSSLYRSGTSAGLTRTDSATLPRWERSSSVMFYNDRFSIESDAPPIPSNAELLYEPPRKSRSEEKPSKRFSTGSLSPKIPFDTPSISNNTHTTSVIVNADDFDPETLLPETPPLENPSIPRLPLPRTPPRLTIDEAEDPDQIPQLLLQDSDLLSSPLSSCHTSPKELEGLLNYYSIPDSPLVNARHFRPMFSPITEESSPQLSPPTSYRSAKRDSQRCQPVGGRRSRDSTVLPMKDPPTPQILLPDASDSSTTISDSSFYFNGSDNPDATLAPPQPNRILSRRRSASIPIKIVRNSEDFDVYNLTTASSFGDATVSAESPMVSQEFPETPNPFTPMLSAGSNAPVQSADDNKRSLEPSMSAESVLAVLPKRTSVQHSRKGSLSHTRSTPSTRSGSPSVHIDISESPEPVPSILSPIADDAITAPLPSSTSGSSANPSNISFSMDACRSSDSVTSIMDMDSPSKSRSLPSIPMTSPILPSSLDDESPPISPPGPSTVPVVLEETFPSPTPSSTVKPSVPRGRLPAALTISRHTSVSEDVAVNGTAVQEGQNSAELELEQPQHDSLSTENTLTYRNETFRGRASDIFRGTSLGSPPPYYSIVSDALMEDNRLPNFFGLPFSFSQSQGSDNIAGPSSGESSTFSNDIGRPRENSVLGQRTRTRPPLPAGPRRPSQPSIISPGPRRGSFSSITSSTAVPDPRTRLPLARYNNNPTPSPSFQTPPPKWKGYTLEVAKWTFTSAQLQAIVSKAVRQSAEASSIRLLRLEVLDDEIPDEIRRLESQRTNIKIKYKASSRRRATILDSMYSSSSLGVVVEDVYSSAHRLARQLDELKELTQTLDQLAEELHSVDQQLSHLESLIHVHNGSALAMALRKLNSSFLQQVAENQVLRSQIQTLEAERDEAWQQAQSVANEYDQVNDDNNMSTTTHSSRVSAKRKSCIRVSKAGLRTPSRRFSRRSSAGGSASARSPPLPSMRSPPPPLPIQRPMDILTDSPGSSNAFSTSGITPTSETRALAKVQDELYAMLGILNPERAGGRLHRSRSEIISPVSPSSRAVAVAAAAESPRTRYRRRSSLPGSLSLTEAYNAMAVDRNVVLATIDMLNI